MNEERTLTGSSSVPQLSSLTAVILAGGFGTRLRSAVGELPKPLAPVAGRPFLTYLLDQLARAGVRQAVLCTGYHGERIRAELGHEYAGVTLVYSHETEPLGTGGAIRQALAHIDSDTVLVLNGDSYCAADFAAFHAWHAQQRGEGTLLLAHQADTRSFGRVETDNTGRIAKFWEKGDIAEPGWINAGVCLFARRLLEEIPTGRAISLEKEMYPRWIERGLYGWRSEAPFLDIGTPASYRRAAAFFAALVATPAKAAIR